MTPTVHEFSGILVVRDDLFPGGTKARFIPRLFDGADEVVYASPAEGGAQFALATVARQLGKKATIFVAARADPHPRAFEAKTLGATVRMISPGYLTVVQARARAYCEATGARLAPFGMDLPEAVEKIASAARKAIAAHPPDEVWCAAGSGTLMRALALAWPHARRHAVQVGRTLTAEDVAGATIHISDRKFGDEARTKPPFPSDPHYDAKAWEMATARRGPGRVVFWNVAPPARPLSSP